MSKLWHVGLAVPDLTDGLALVGALFDLEWRPVVTRSLTITDGDGMDFEVDCRVTFSLGGPFAVEVWEGIPGTPLAVPDAGWVHHLGYWVDDYATEEARLADLGFSRFLSAVPHPYLGRGPGGLCVEPCDISRDMPYLRDLFPDGSPFNGEPEFPPTDISSGLLS